MTAAVGASRGSGHNSMNDPAPSIPLEPIRRETPDDHRARMEAKSARARRFDGLTVAAHPSRPTSTPHTMDSRARAVAAYRDGAALKAVTAEYKVGPATLRGWLADAGVPVRNPGPTARSLRTSSTEERDRLTATTAYVAGDEVPQIAARLSRSTTTIYRWLRAAGVQMRGPHRPTLDTIALAAEYEAGARVADLAAREGVDPKTLTKALRTEGVQIRRGGRSAATADREDVQPPAAPAESSPASTEPEPVDAPAEVPDAIERHRADPCWERPTVEARTPHGSSPAEQRALLREATRPHRPDPSPADLPQIEEALAAVRGAAEYVLAAADELAGRWSHLQLARDLDATASFARIRVSAEQLLALAAANPTERTPS